MDNIPSVNLWELITTVAGRDLPNQERCKAIQAVIGPRFASELSLTILSNGTWLISAFDHEDETQRVDLYINPDGRLKIERSRTRNDIHEVRSVSF